MTTASSIPVGSSDPSRPDSGQSRPNTKEAEANFERDFSGGGSLPPPWERGSLLDAPVLYEDWCRTFGHTVSVLESDREGKLPEYMRRSFEGLLDSPWAEPCLWLYPPPPPD